MFPFNGPIRKLFIPNQRTGAADSFQAHIFYLPFYFQAVKGTTAEGSGIRTIPYLGSIIVASIVVGAAITMLGWYKPFMIAGGCIFTVGSGLIYTLTVNSATGKWIGYQLLCGFGAGAGVQSKKLDVRCIILRLTITHSTFHSRSSSP